MSKSPSTFIPAILGGTALAIGLAYGVANRNYGANQIEQLTSSVERAQTQASVATQAAKTEAQRAAELEQKIAEVQATATERLTTPAPIPDVTYGLGRPAHAEEIAAWDVDVLPDGRGLPEGSGDVWTGEDVYADKCAACHGDFAEGVDNWPVLAGGFDTLADEDPVKTVGSYWPHLSTAWDYISRSMPFGDAGTLTPDETYAIVAYILYSNDLVDDDFELNHENLADFDMYNMEGFVIDDRPELEYSQWRADPCMENCKDEVEVTMRSVFLVETPPEGGSNSVMNHARDDALPSFTAAGPSFIPDAAPAQPVQAAAKAEDPDDGTTLIAAGERVFRKCSACHQVGEGAKNGSGPHLNALLGRTMGAVDGFSYSAAFKTALDEGRIWDEQSLAAFLAKPKAFMPGTKMSFSGLKKEGDQEAIIAYLSSFPGD
ncbi:MAG: c-type cytochrome [Pseudomonadota bacterium]